MCKNRRGRPMISGWFQQGQHVLDFKIPACREGNIRQRKVEFSLEFNPGPLSAYSLIHWTWSYMHWSTRPCIKTTITRGTGHRGLYMSRFQASKHLKRRDHIKILKANVFDWVKRCLNTCSINIIQLKSESIKK